MWPSLRPQFSPPNLDHSRLSAAGRERPVPSGNPAYLHQLQKWHQVVMGLSYCFHLSVISPRWDEYHFGKCGKVLKLSALKLANSHCKKEFLYETYLRSYSLSSLQLAAGIFWVFCAQIGCQKKKMTSPGSAQKLSERLPLYSAFKCILVSNSELNWLGKNKLGCWEHQQTVCTTMESMAFGQHNSFCSTSSNSWIHKEKSGKMVFSS